MKPTRRINRPHVIPSIAELVTVLVTTNRDRGSMVRRGATGQTAAVTVALLSPQAVRDIGPFLRSHCARLPQDSSQRITMAVDTPLSKLYSTMEALRLQWNWLHLRAPSALSGPQGQPNRDLECLCLTVIGPTVTPTFAAELTQLGCPTSLT
jgi:hypothetical protein